MVTDAGRDRCGDGPPAAGAGGQPGRECGGGRGVRPSFGVRGVGRAWGRAVIPPRRDAKIQRHGNTSGPRLARDENLRRIRQIGRSAWKGESGYHERSLAETAMFRMKTIFGDGVSSRDPGPAGDRGGGAVPGVEHHDPPGDAAERAGCGVIPPAVRCGERPVRSPVPFMQQRHCDRQKSLINFGGILCFKFDATVMQPI